MRRASLSPLNRSISPAASNTPMPPARSIPDASYPHSFWKTVLRSVRFRQAYLEEVYPAPPLLGPTPKDKSIEYGHVPHLLSGAQDPCGGIAARFNFLSLGCRQPDRPGQRAPGSCREGFGGEIREGTQGAGGGRLRAGGERRDFWRPP
jgi:hypothetical protein